MDAKELVFLGLSKSEAEVYLSILQRGKASIKHVAADTGLHRPNVYDLVAQLREKGLVGTIVEGRHTMCFVSDPQNLYSFIDDRKVKLDSVFTQLQLLYNSHQQDTSVEVFGGKEGIKTICRDMILENKPICGFGLDRQLRDALPEYALQWFRDLRENSIGLKAIYNQEQDLPKISYGELRWMPQAKTNPVTTFIYGDKVTIHIWSKTIVGIVIRSKDVADMYRTYFDVLWNSSKSVV